MGDPWGKGKETNQSDRRRGCNEEEWVQSKYIIHIYGKIVIQPIIMYIVMFLSMAIETGWFDYLESNN